MTGRRVETLVSPGSGALAQIGDGAVFAVGVASEEVLETLVESLHALCLQPGVSAETLVAGMRSVLAELGDDVLPGCAVLAPATDGWAFVLRGALELHATHPDGEDVRISGPDMQSGVLPAGATRLDLAGPEQATTTEPTWFQLDGGIAQAGRAALLVGGGPAAAPAGPAEPLVEGILCAQGHFTHPNALSCPLCGVAIVRRADTTIRGTRPSLGQLVLDDGTTYPLDSNYLIGRDPDLEPAKGATRLLSLQDAERSVSRVHAEIRLEGWDVYVVDRGSANGTFVVARDETAWRRLQPGKSERVRPGSRIAFGRRSVSYDARHQG